MTGGGVASHRIVVPGDQEGTAHLHSLRVICSYSRFCMTIAKKMGKKKQNNRFRRIRNTF